MVSWVTYGLPSRFIETSAWKSSAVRSVNGLVKKMPAILTSASIDRKRASAVRKVGEEVMATTDTCKPLVSGAGDGRVRERTEYGKGPGDPR
jgi:hypothetical protein